MVVDNKLTHSEYILLRAIIKIDLLNNDSYFEYLESPLGRQEYRQEKQKDSFFGSAACFLFNNIKWKLGFSKENFKRCMEQLEEKGFFKNRFYELQPSADDAMKRYAEDYYNSLLK